MAITICYIYQLVLFAAVIAISARREETGYQSFFCCYKANPHARCILVEKCVEFQGNVVKFWAKSVTQWRMR